MFLISNMEEIKYSYSYSYSYYMTLFIDRKYLKKPHTNTCEN